MTKAADVVVGPDGKSHYVPNPRIEAIAARPEHQGKAKFRNWQDGWLSWGHLRRMTGDQRARAAQNRPKDVQWRRDMKARRLKEMRRRQQAQARAPNTPWKRAKGFGGKVLRGAGTAGGVLTAIGMLKMLLGKSEEDKRLEDQFRLAQFAQQANERYNKAMYPEYFT